MQEVKKLFKRFYVLRELKGRLKQHKNSAGGFGFQIIGRLFLNFCTVIASEVVQASFWSLSLIICSFRQSFLSRN